MEDVLLEFTLAEILKMESLYKELDEYELPSKKLCKKLAKKFSRSTNRSGTPDLNWEQIQAWFIDKRKNSVSEDRFNLSPAKDVTTSDKRTPCLFKDLVPQIAQIPNNRIKIPLKTKAERIAELSELIFEAVSSKDLAWYDVAAFLNYRVLYSGELEARVRFAGFGHKDDEWVNVKRGVRKRSIPLEPSECHKLKPGDPILCYKENDSYALYGDAQVLEIDKREHGADACTCMFLVRYDYDRAEVKVPLTYICCRAT